MPIVADRALGATLPVVSYHWDPEKVILYHLGLGAGVPAVDAGELAYVYEENLKVLPTFAVIAAFPALDGTSGVDGVSFDSAMMLHGEQDLEIHTPVPARATVRTDGRIAAIYDKGKAAVMVVETTTTDDRGTRLFTNRFTSFIRGEGGFGGPSGPAPGNTPPDRAPDHVVSSPTLPQQALLYRLSGDPNPLHVDPAVAREAGFDTPILHGLCSYGIVCKAVVDTLLGGDVTRVARYQARFVGVVFPGETIVTAMWEEGDRIILSASTRERGTPVLSNAAVTPA